MMASNPKTILLCIGLFLASAMITLSIKSPHHHSSAAQLSSNSWLSKLPFTSTSPSTHSKKKRPPQKTNQRPLNEPKVAFATFLAGNANPSRQNTDEESAAIDDTDDGYFIGARVMIYQLLHSKSAGTNASIPVIVLCTKEVSPRKRARLEADGATVVLVDKLRVDWVTPGVERWQDVLTKLRLFELTQYQKICFIDADVLITAPLDGVFYDEATLTQPTQAIPAEIKEDEGALPRTYMFATHAELFTYNHPYPPDLSLTYLNVGFFVFTPSLMLFNFYMSLLKLPGRFDPGFPGMSSTLLSPAYFLPNSDIFSCRQNKICSIMPTVAKAPCRGNRCGMGGTLTGQPRTTGGAVQEAFTRNTGTAIRATILS